MVQTLNQQTEDVRNRRKLLRQEELITFDEEQLKRHIKSDREKLAANFEKRKFIANVQKVYFICDNMNYDFYLLRLDLMYRNK